MPVGARSLGFASLWGTGLAAYLAACAHLPARRDAMVEVRGPECRLQWTLEGNQAILTWRLGPSDSEGPRARQSAPLPRPATPGPPPPRPPAGKPRRTPGRASRPPPPRRTTSRPAGHDRAARTGTRDPSPAPAARGSTFTTHLSDDRVRRVLSLFLLDDLRGLSDRYENRCASSAPPVRFSVRARSWHKVVHLRGYLPPALAAWWRRLLEESRLAQRLPGDPARILRRCVAPGTEAPVPTLPVSSEGNCVSEEVGLVHDPVEELWRGRPALVLAIAPRGWKLTLSYRWEGAPYYRAVPMRRRGCAYVAAIPQEHLRPGTLYYYIEARDRTGRRALGSGSKGSPNIVEVRSCLVVGSAGTEE